MITYKLLTNKGERSINEDSIGVARNKDLYCFILADGLGGHGGGDLASASAVKTIQDYFSQNGEISQQCMENCIIQAQNKLLEVQERMNKTNEMKTTLVVLIMNEKKALWGHVGDSRLYHFFGKKQWIRTRDHSVPQMLVELGEIKESEIRGHEDRNRVLNVLGTEWDMPQYEIDPPIMLTGGKDAFLLCTDGFWELIDEKMMLKTLKHASDMERWLLKMEEYLWKTGRGSNMDNYSAIAIRV